MKDAGGVHVLIAPIVRSGCVSTMTTILATFLTKKGVKMSTPKDNDVIHYSREIRKIKSPILKGKFEYLTSSLTVQAFHFSVYDITQAIWPLYLLSIKGTVIVAHIKRT